MASNQQIFIHAGSYDGSLLGFKGSLKDLQSQYAFSASLGCIKSVANVGRYLLIGGSEETIKIYDIRKKVEVGLLEGHTGTITVIRSYENFVFSGSEDRTIRVWKTRDWGLLQTLPLKATIIDIQIHKSGKIMVSLTKDQKIQIWNLLTMGRIFQRRYLLDGLQKLVFLDSDSDDMTTILLLGQKQLAFVDCETNKICYSANFKATLTDLITLNRYAIVSDQNGFVYFITITSTSHKVVMSFQAHTQRVKQLAVINGDLTLLCTISTNGELKLWDCLNYLTDEVEETIEFGDKMKPINLINTKARLTCLSAHVFESKKTSEDAVTIHNQNIKKSVNVKPNKIKQQQNITQVVKKISKSKIQDHNNVQVKQKKQIKVKERQREQKVQNVQQQNDNIIHSKEKKLIKVKVDKKKINQKKQNQVKQ